MLYRYGLTMRPPDPGALPREGLTYVTFADKGAGNPPYPYWGTAEYTRELTEDELRHYDMELIRRIET